MAESALSPSPESPVLVIGSASIDFVGRLDAELKLGTSNPARIRTSYGGVARNVAENLARLGHEVRLLAVVGTDPTGGQLLEHTTHAGVDTQHVLRTPEHRTGAYLAVVNRTGELQFALDDMQAITSLTPDYVREHKALFKDSSALFVDANVSEATMRTAFHLARRARLPIFADPTSASLANRLTTFLPQIFAITPNMAEAEAFCGRSFNPREPQEALLAAKHLVGQGVQIAIVTLAEFGVCYATSETSGYIPAIRTEILDPTGAGDALTAAVIFGLLNDIPVDESVRLGISAASLTLRTPGAVVRDLSLERLYDQLII